MCVYTFTFCVLTSITSLPAQHISSPSSPKHRPYFSFDPAVVKKVTHSRSNDSLDKAMEDPVRPLEEEPTSSEVVVSRRGRDRVRRYSAPPIRDSVGSIDYLSESQGGREIVRAEEVGEKKGGRRWYV